MKTVLFISSNKMLGQGLSSAIQAKPELEVRWAGQLPYPQAIVGVEIYQADVMILDIVDQTELEQAVGICRSLRRGGAGCQDPAFSAAGAGRGAQGGSGSKKHGAGR